MTLEIGAMAYSDALLLEYLKSLDLPEFSISYGELHKATGIPISTLTKCFSRLVNQQRIERIVIPGKATRYKLR